MKQFILRHSTTLEEYTLEAIGWGYSKGEKHYQFYCDEKGKIIEKSIPAYQWMLIEIKEL